MRQDRDPWFSSEFWQRAVIGILTLAVAYLLVLPATGHAAETTFARTIGVLR
ncbi:hypothetical protein [Cupriavidus pauculus]|jgi:hypothetical protein|uniref:hypothetical protein n=1 Tax=Cupriavidus pauculus TaxID=82633 RepID=UPI0012FD1C6D|nr:hypothetical protein [Cupriavidus pauculus]MBY4731983.1 hypothetical protein [Cupriavidus pauculus]MCM3605771.1 hypothetical protein [Cupriavidus pauculus]UAL02268.1 hypothetical protein K8O84_26160 [Cupriavidus pauculus]